MGGSRALTKRVAKFLLRIPVCVGIKSIQSKRYGAWFVWVREIFMRAPPDCDINTCVRRNKTLGVDFYK
jgi:hypothetical protein